MNDCSVDSSFLICLAVYMYLECAHVESSFPAELVERYFVSNHIVGVGAMGTVSSFDLN